MNAVTTAPMRALRPLVAILAVALATAGLTVVTTTPASAEGATSRATSFSSDAYEEKVQYFINQRRSEHGLSKLSLDACTDGTAESWAQKLAESHEFYHQSMSNILDKCDAFYAGETLGKGAISPNRLVYLWMHSPAHRDVLLSRHAKRIGVGAYVDSTGAWVTAANFTKL